MKILRSVGFEEVEGRSILVESMNLLSRLVLPSAFTQKIILRCLILFVIALLCVMLSTFIYALFYYSWIPRVAHEHELYFDFEYANVCSHFSLHLCSQNDNLASAISDFSSLKVSELVDTYNNNWLLSD